MGGRERTCISGRGSCPSTLLHIALDKNILIMLTTLINPVLQFNLVVKKRRGLSMRDKRDRFVELAESRVTKAVQTIRLIGNLANANNYAYSEEDAQKILTALDGEMKLLKAKFQTALSKRAMDEFKLD